MNTKKLSITAIAVITALILSGCGSSSSASDVSSGPTPDASAEMACDHFRNVISDVGKGLLSNDEFRAKLKEVYGDGYVSTNAGIASGVTAMMRADTAGDVPALKNAIADFATACIGVGH